MRGSFGRADEPADLEITESEDALRIHEAGLDWDLGVQVYQPADPAQIATGAEGRKLGVHDKCPTRRLTIEATFGV